MRRSFTLKFADDMGIPSVPNLLTNLSEDRDKSLTLRLFGLKSGTYELVSSKMTKNTHTWS